MGHFRGKQLLLILPPAGILLEIQVDGWVVVGGGGGGVAPS